MSHALDPNCLGLVQTATVDCTSVHNQFTVEVCTKLVYWLIITGMYMDRTKVRLFVQCKLVGNSLNKLKVDI